MSFISSRSILVGLDLTQFITGVLAGSFRDSGVGNGAASIFLSVWYSENGRANIDSRLVAASDVTDVLGHGA